MAFYVVVHHRRDSNQPWPGNVWGDDSRLLAIETTPQIADRCATATAQNERIFVHRCAWDGGTSVVACSVRVSRVAAIDRRTSLVEFTDQVPLAFVPPVQPLKGQNCYDADPPREPG